MKKENIKQKPSDEALIIQYEKAIEDGDADYKTYDKLAMLYFKKSKEKSKANGDLEEIRKLRNLASEFLQKALTMALTGKETETV